MNKRILGLIVFGICTVLAMAETPLPPTPPALKASLRMPGFASPAVAQAAGTYNGLFALESTNSIDSSGAISLKLTTNGVYSGVLSIGGGNVPFSGRFSPDGIARLALRNATDGKERLTLSLSLDVTNHTNQMTGTVQGPFGTSLLRAVRAVEPPAKSGNHFVDQRFTLLLSPVMSGGRPVSGCGYGVGSLAGSGQASISGCLADGSAFNQSVFLSRSGEWSFRVVLTAGRESRAVTGVLQGWLAVTNGVPSGALTWVVPARSNAVYYTAGFTNSITAAGYAYRAEAPDQPVLRASHPEVTLSGGDLNRAATIPVSFSGNDAAVAGGNQRLKLDFYRSSGLLTGGLPSPADASRTLVIKGIVIQSEHCARGFITGNGQTGEFLLRDAGSEPQK